MRKINKADFIITTTAKGNKTARWKHNNRAIRTFYGYSAEAKANGYIKFLTDWYATNNYQFDNEGKIYIGI